MSHPMRFLLCALSLWAGAISVAEEKPAADQASKRRRPLIASPRAVSPKKEKGATEPAAPLASDDLKSPKNSPKAPAKVPALDEMILFQPRRDGDWAPQGVTYTDVDFESADGTALHAWYCPAEKPRAVVLYCHGNAGNISIYADYLEFLRTKHRLSVLAFDYRGYGKSKGTPTVEGVIADGRAARAKCAELGGVTSADVIVWGRSMGGAVAVQLASEERPRGLILECTFDSFKTVARHHAPRWAFLVPDDRLASAQRIPQVTCPLFQVHGTADRVVPYASGVTLFEAANQPKQFVKLPNCDHNTAPPLRLYTQIDQFIDQQCSMAVSR